MAREPVSALPRVDELSALLDCLRAKGVVKFVHGGTEILLGPPPMARAKKENGASDEVETRRRHYEDMLGRRVTDQELEHLP